MTPWWNNSPNIKFDKTSLPRDLDAHLAAQEARVANIRPGLQKQIVWADPAAKTKTPYSVIYLHGFSASSGEMRPVPDLVAKHLGANLYFSRQAGHGTDGDSLGRATLAAWLDDVAEAIAIGERIGEEVIVMATSTGAALATWALTQPPLAEKIAAAVLLSPNYQLQARGAFLLGGPFARQIARLVIGRTRGFEPINAEHARIWTHRYSTDALLPLAKAIQLANRAPVETIRVPAMFIYSPDDRVVVPRRTELIASRWSAPHKLLAMPRTEDLSAHVIAGDVLSPGNTMPVTRAICDWLDSTLPSHDNAVISRRHS